MAGTVDNAGLAELYRDLHTHPELSFQEIRTAEIVAGRLRAAGYETTGGVGGTGVVGVLRNGDGPTVLVRADMDALPVLEQTGLEYASSVRATDADGNDVPVMHACGHDVHVTCLLGAAAALSADRSTWRGTLLLVFQPAEEVGRGAQAMIDDGLFDRFGRPVVVLGQHVTPMPAGLIGIQAGPSWAASDSLRIVLTGRGAHGSQPETSVDPVVMAAATVLRLQGIVSREVSGAETAVLTVGAVHAGSKANVIPDSAELLVNIRTYDAGVRDRILAAIDRIVRAEAAASGAPTAPEITVVESIPAVVVDPAAGARTRRGFVSDFGDARVIDLGPINNSEDVGLLAEAAGAPCVFWLIGGADPALFAGARGAADVQRIVRDLPSNHSPRYAPVVEPTLGVGVAALLSAVRTWLPAS